LFRPSGDKAARRDLPDATHCSLLPALTRHRIRFCTNLSPNGSGLPQIWTGRFRHVAGRAVLSYLGVTVHAFSISGGILLFVAAMPMLFGQRGGLQSAEPKEHGSVGEDISVFPLAMPMLSGPGTIATILLLTSQ